MAVTKKAEKKPFLESKTVVWTFANGEVRTFELDKVSPQVQIQLALHGASQKGGDSYAGDETVEDAIKSCEGVINDLYAGNWSTRAVGQSRSTLLAQAIARIAKQDVAAVTAQLEAMEEEKVKAISKHPQVKSMINTIKGERLKAAEANAEDLATLFAS